MKIIRLALFLFFASTSYKSTAQGYSVRGVVKSSTGELLPFTTVSLKSTSKAGISDSLGAFIINDVKKGEYQLTASSVGYKNFEKKIVVNGTISVEDIFLESAGLDLDEVVVRQEKQTKILETKPLSVKSIEIRNVITQNVLLTDIVDRISGVRIRRSSSLGDRSDISINGIRGEAVRVYIDGIPMELLYPNFDISMLPLANIKRLDVYKGVLPVDVGTDAMGGGINIITEQKSYNSLKATYFAGSYNTHLADVNVGLANKKNYFLNLSAAYNYSDNSYGMNALVYETNKVERVRRFHDQFRFFYGGITAGVHSKPWADELRLTFNYSKGYKELQNGARVNHVAFGGVVYHAENTGLTLKYDKSLNEKLLFTTIGNYSYQMMNYVDTTSNVYSWSGKIVGRNAPGEYTAERLTDNYSLSWINRSGLSFNLRKGHRIMASNLYARQRLTGVDFLEKEISEDYLRIPQTLMKNVFGLQYEGVFYDKLTLSAALKRFDYVLNGAENYTFELVEKKDGIWGWNSGLKYDIDEAFFVRASYEKGYLIPQFYQFVGNGADVLRNTGLIPESSNNLNAGIAYTGKSAGAVQFSTTLNGFYRLQNDIIFLGTSLLKVYENADQVQTVGFEGEATAKHTKGFSLSTNVTFLRKKFTKLKDPNNQYLVGAAFPNNPNFFGNLELAWQKSNLWIKNGQFRVYTFYNYVAPFNHILVGKNNSIKTTPDAYVPVQNRVDAGCSYKFPKQNLTASVNVINLLSQELYDNFLVPRAGINFNARIIYELTKF